ncbi:MAG: aminopeptidase, partial [Bacteroidetes bacterium RIFCSPLOWO2_12_FULL_31_6]
MNRLLALLFITLVITSCKQKNNQNSNNMVLTEEKNQIINATDAHTCAKPNEVLTTHLDLDVEVDFKQKQIKGKATFQIKNLTATDHIFFDTYDLTIQKVTVGKSEKETKFELGTKDENLGQALKVYIDSNVEMLTIYYSSDPTAQALQWLDAKQTSDKKSPFLFTQSESIFARSWVPCQDSPGIRFTYNATVKVPKDLLAVMSAENPITKNDSGIYYFNMPQAIPAYLLALAVGDIEFKSVGPRTGIYAEHSMLDKTVYEFGETEDMLVAAEKLYGAYRWGRYDIIVLPPSFPFGGMENPRLTFATPTVIAGDRSLTSLVAHEMAHSWSGNLVTNATWNDFWLNEGFTVYFERRILEKIYGHDYTEMQAVLAKQDVIETMAELGITSGDTKLKLNLNGRHPDDGMTDVAYEKGYLFLRLIEENVGREKLDAFLNKY